MDIGAVAPPSARRPSAAARGYDRDWRDLREQHINAHPLCDECGELAGEVDHIQPITAGGERLARDNLRSLCGPCHRAMTANYRTTGRNEMPRLKRPQ